MIQARPFYNTVKFNTARIPSMHKQYKKYSNTESEDDYEYNKDGILNLSSNVLDIYI